ncbi:hypothetical protein NPIL_510741 [Nephila pilipes]|uniref:Uncharacterized protein n=1 Tax=Nephila pilipes TaxID=299642 RepID=A0A8X6PDN2_NEPPI|nr:hypothetical protein NPIL_510741 [Nephila pilipes]
MELINSSKSYDIRVRLKVLWNVRADSKEEETFFSKHLAIRTTVDGELQNAWQGLLPVKINEHWPSEEKNSLYSTSLSGHKKIFLSI